MGSGQLAAADFDAKTMVTCDESSSSEISVCDRMPMYVKELIAGGAAGGFAKTVVAPLERIKILYQTRYGRVHCLGVLQSLHYIYKSEGFWGFYKGNGASVIRVVPYAALHFMTYEQYKRWLLNHYPWASPSAVVDLLAGSMAGGTAVLCTYPLDLARTRLAYQVSDMSTGGTVYKGITDVFSKALKENGIRGLYRGIGPTLYGMLPYAGLKFYIYEKLKGSLPDAYQGSVISKLACGATAGVLGQTIIYPLDVVRRQMQIQSSIPSKQVYKSTLDGLLIIARTQGVRQLFAGLGINHIKLVPSVAIGFATYDSLKTWLGVLPPETNRKGE